MQDELLTIAEAADALRISTKTLRRKMASRELSVLRDRRIVLIPRSSLNAYIERHTLAARVEPVAATRAATIAPDAGSIRRRPVSKLWEIGA